MLNPIRPSTILLSLTIFRTLITTYVYGQTASDVSIATDTGTSADCVAAKNCFSPNPATVALGTTVTWTNNDKST